MAWRDRYVNVRITAVREPDVEEREAGPNGVCAGCSYVISAESCRAGRDRAKALGLPGCEAGFVYQEEAV